MNDTFWTNALNFASETKVKDIFVNMLAASFSWRYACKHLDIGGGLRVLSIGGEIIGGFGVSGGFLAVLGFIIESRKGFGLVGGFVKVTATHWSLGRNQFFQLWNTLRIQWCPLVTKFTNDALTLTWVVHWQVCVFSFRSWVFMRRSWDRGHDCKRAWECPREGCCT